MKWVKWSDWTRDEHRIVPEGEMTEPEAEAHIRKLGEEAAKLLKESGADHVVYALKHIGTDGSTEEVEFHMIELSDEDFEERAANQPGVIVYAHHARK